MKVTILTSSDELNLALCRYVGFALPVEASDCYLARLGAPESMEPEMFSSDLWIVEAVNPGGAANPEGFRTGKKLIGKAKILLIFAIMVPPEFPSAGRFWMTAPWLTTLAQKVSELLDGPPQSLEEFESLEKAWPVLRLGPRHHGSDEARP